MTQQDYRHPITPAPELVQQWFKDSVRADEGALHLDEKKFAFAAAQWGADQELEACVEWLEDVDCDDPQETANCLRDARRPKPPSLKEQALEWLIAAEELHKVSGIDPEGIIRRALEAIPDNQ
jgi:hypothetical protein